MPPPSESLLFECRNFSPNSVENGINVKNLAQLALCVRLYKNFGCQGEFTYYDGSNQLKNTLSFQKCQRKDRRKRNTDYTAVEEEKKINEIRKTLIELVEEHRHAFFSCVFKNLELELYDKFIELAPHWNETDLREIHWDFFVQDAPKENQYEYVLNKTKNYLNSTFGKPGRRELIEISKKINFVTFNLLRYFTLWMTKFIPNNQKVQELREYTEYLIFIEIRDLMDQLEAGHVWHWELDDLAGNPPSEPSKCDLVLPSIEYMHL